MKILYTTKATSTGGRTGSSETEDGRLKVTLSTPKELGGDGGAGTNPEQLFSAGYSACFLGALKLVSGKAGVKLPAETTVAAIVGFGMNEDGKPGLSVSLEISSPGIEKSTLEKLVETAHGVCPYSSATRGNIDVKLAVV